MKRISVIIPCYNARNYIDRLMQSVTSQTFPLSDVEVICVNDASTDDTLEILKTWEEKYPDSVMIIDCEKNGHLGKARNIGFQYASAEWIAFIDADDWVERDYLEVLYNAAVENDCQIAACKDIRDMGTGERYLYDVETGSERGKAPKDDGSRSEGADNALTGDKDTGDRGSEKSRAPGGTSSVSGEEIKIITYDINTPVERSRYFKTQPLKLYAWGRLIKKQFLEDFEIFFPEYLAYEDIVWGNLVNMYVDRACLVDRVMYHYYVNPQSIVLKKNEKYHLDHLTTQEIMWEQFAIRGFLDEYPEEAQYEYLYNGYLAMLKILALRYDEPSYSVFRLLQELTRSKVAQEYIERLIADDAVPEFHRLLFGMIHQNVSRTDFDQIVNAVRQTGI
jgi:glycosyltransferase involved in cell wall biosynthesis